MKIVPKSCEFRFNYCAVQCRGIPGKFSKIAEFGVVLKDKKAPFVCRDGRIYQVTCGGGNVLHVKVSAVCDGI